MNDDILLKLNNLHCSNITDLIILPIYVKLLYNISNQNTHKNFISEYKLVTYKLNYVCKNGDKINLGEMPINIQITNNVPFKLYAILNGKKKYIFISDWNRPRMIFTPKNNFKKLGMFGKSIFDYSILKNYFNEIKIEYDKCERITINSKNEEIGSINKRKIFGTAYKYNFHPILLNEIYCETVSERDVSITIYTARLWK